MYAITSASLSDTGRVREINEDSVLEAGNLFAVADGMGGHQAGEVASDLALAVIGQYIEDNLGLIGGEKLVEKAVSSANAAVHQKAASSSRYRDMGTTVTLLYREGDTAYVGHVGDSRAYLYRGGVLRTLTRDHSLVATLVEEGEITEEEARVHPQRNIILRALGLEAQVEVDVVSVKIEPGDVFVLATDGMTGLVADDAIREVLSAEGEPVPAARRLVDLALGAGGHDNVSVVLVSFRGSETVVPSRAARALELEAEDAAGAEAPGPGKGRRKATRWIFAGAVLALLLAALLGVAVYFYNQTYYVGARSGKVTLFKGFPFWDLGMVERQTDTSVRFLPEALRRRVEGKLEPQSRKEAEATIESLEREAAKNSVYVPDVLGKKFNQARADLEGLGLRVESVLVSRPNIAAETVIEQSPLPGARVGVGSQVTLEVVMPGSPAREV